MQIRNDQQTRIKICFVLPHFRSGGLEQVVLNIITHINRDLFRPALLLLNRDGQLLQKLPEDVEIIHLNNIRTSMAIIPMAKALKSMNPDIVYTGTNAISLLVLLSKKITSINYRTIITEHTPLDLLLKDSKWLSPRVMMMKYLYKQCDLFAAPVKEICEEHKSRLNLPELKTAVLNNPVLSENDFITSEPPALIKGISGPLFIAAGRLSDEKQFDTMINCFASLRQKHPTAELIILGEGAERKKLEEIISGLDIKDAVHLPGYVTDTAKYFRYSTALLCCSRREGFGNVLVEAMAQGTPVISTDCPFGPRNILNHGRAGILVTPGDKEAFITAMDRIITDQKMHKNLSGAGKLAIEKYMIKNAVKQLEDTCLELISKELSVKK